MAEEAKKKPEGGAAEKPAEKNDGGKAGLMTKTPVLIGGVMIIEAMVLFAGFKFLGSGPKAASGAELVSEETATEGHAAEGGHGEGGAAPARIEKGKAVEVPVLELRAPNSQSGRVYFYDVSIYAVTKAEFADRVKETITQREALIKDRVRTIIGTCDPEKLGGGSEPGLETLRRQVKYQLDEILGEGVIDEVLVPRCIPFRTDF